MSGGVPAGELREQIAQIVARAYGGSLCPGMGTPGDYPTAHVDYRAANAILALLTPTPPSRDADVERVKLPGLATYWLMDSARILRSNGSDMHATEIEGIAAALQALGERGCDNADRT